MSRYVYFKDVKTGKELELSINTDGKDIENIFIDDIQLNHYVKYEDKYTNEYKIYSIEGVVIKIEHSISKIPSFGSAGGRYYRHKTIIYIDSGEDS